jgi:hypothetical protein
MTRTAKRRPAKGKRTKKRCDDCNDWKTVPRVAITEEVALCAACGSPRKFTSHTVGDKSEARRDTTCKDCGRLYRVFVKFIYRRASNFGTAADSSDTIGVVDDITDNTRHDGMTLVNLTSIGVLASELLPRGLGVRQVQAAAIDLGILPTFTIDGVPHFSPEQCERIRDRLAEVEAENGRPLPQISDPRFALPVFRGAMM